MSTRAGQKPHDIVWYEDELLPMLTAKTRQVLEHMGVEAVEPVEVSTFSNPSSPLVADRVLLRIDVWVKR